MHGQSHPYHAMSCNVVVCDVMSRLVRFCDVVHGVARFARIDSWGGGGYFTCVT